MGFIDAISRDPELLRLALVDTFQSITWQQFLFSAFLTWAWLSFWRKITR